jgi:hypothetical protein
MSILDRYQHGRWAPVAGWQPDTTVILGVRALLTDTLGGVAEDILPGEVELPGHVGAVVACSWRWHPPRPYVYIRADQPTDLRADLWGFATALAVCVCQGRVPLGEEDFLFVGNQRTPVRNWDTGLLGALILQRLGRKATSCDFPVFRWTGTADSPSAAAA